MPHYICRSCLLSGQHVISWGKSCIFVNLHTITANFHLPLSFFFAHSETIHHRHIQMEQCFQCRSERRRERSILLRLFKQPHLWQWIKQSFFFWNHDKFWEPQKDGTRGKNVQIRKPFYSLVLMCPFRLFLSILHTEAAQYWCLFLLMPRIIWGINIGATWRLKAVTWKR